MKKDESIDAMSRGMFWEFLVPLGILAAITAVIAVTGSDIAIMSRFYIPGQGWVFADATPWRQLYNYGIFPGFLIAISALCVLIAGFFSPRYLSLRKFALFFVLLLAIGPGLVVNVIFKDHWGRPRPRQIQAFGGEMRFQEVWEKGVANRGRSFPSGHASMAFYLISPYFVLRKSARRRWGVAFLIAGSAYGCLMGTARVMQGAHFPSDIVWAGGFVYLAGLLLYHLLGLNRETGMESFH